MTKRLYLVPTIEVPVVPPIRSVTGLQWVPKYVHNAGVPWAIMGFGLEPTALLCADVTGVQHTQLAGQSDVTAIPQNLDSQLGAQLATVEAALEAINLPADWVQATHTYRLVLRMVTGAIRVSQRVHGLMHASGKLFPPGITLDAQYSQLAPGIQSALVQTAQEMGIDHSNLTNTSTLRAILRTFGNQLPPISLLGVEI